MSRVGEVMDASQKPPSPQERSPTQSKWTKLRKLIFHRSKRKEKEKGGQGGVPKSHFPNCHVVFGLNPQSNQGFWSLGHMPCIGHTLELE